MGSGLITELPGPQDVGLDGVLTPVSAVMDAPLRPGTHPCFNLLSFAWFSLCLASPVAQSLFSKPLSLKIGDGGEKGGKWQVCLIRSQRRGEGR